MPANVARCGGDHVRCQAEDGRGACDGEGVRGVVAARGREPGRRRAGQRVEAVEFQGRALRVAGGHPAEQRRGRTVRGRKSLGDRAGVAAQPLWCLVDECVGEDRAGPVGKPVEDGLDAGIADVGDDRGSPRRPAQPRLEGRLDRRPIGEDVRVVPFGAGQDRQRRDGRHRSCRRTRRPRRRTRRRSPTEPWPAGRP